MNPKEKQLVAHHEAGHAIVAHFRPTADRVAKISIIPRGLSALGFTQQQPTEDRYVLTRAELLDRLDVMLGGRAAEELVFGDVSTGAQDDLQRATELARDMVTRYGMSDAIGLATYDHVRTPPLALDGRTHPDREYSDATARLVDAELRQLLDAAYHRVHATVQTHERALRALAARLIETEMVDRATLESVIAAAEPKPLSGAVA